MTDALEGGGVKERKAEAGEAPPTSELMSIAYDELRRLAARKLANERPGQTLTPTALVHDAWLRLRRQPNCQFATRTHFFSAAAEAMRRILIERARHRQARRHGGDMERVELVESRIVAPQPDDELLAVDEALDRLAAHDVEKAELVKLRYFVGLTIEETAAVMGISEPTVKRHWAYARAWLFRELRRE
jgi:RNA polymerase sigma factor (TIGR02999 family)